VKNAVFWYVTPCGSLRTDASEERNASIIRVTRIGELGTKFFLRGVLRLLVTANVVPNSPILVTLMMDAIVSPKSRFLHEPHGVTSQKTTFFIVNAVKTSNLTYTNRLGSAAEKLCDSCEVRTGLLYPRRQHFS
jgi:hypothetical protein